MSMTDDENNHFPIGSMVVKGEYLTHDNNARKKGGYVYRDYKPGASVYQSYQLNHWYKPPSTNNAQPKFIEGMLLLAGYGAQETNRDDNFKR